MSLKKILIVDDLHPIFQEKIKKLGYACDNQPSFTKEQALAVIANYQGLVIRTKFRVDQEFIDAGKQLKFIARAGAGMDNIDQKYAESKNIVCINAPEGNRDAVAEHAIGMLLCVMNNLRKADIEIRNDFWKRENNRGRELQGKTVGIIGYGNAGKRFAKKLSGFDVQVIAHDKYAHGFSSKYAKEVSMDELFKMADIVSLHIPLTHETYQMVDDSFFLRFEKPIFFINTARGEIVKTKSLLKYIKTGKILGAGLDVLEKEGFPQLFETDWYDELIKNEQVLLSPHIAGWTFESYLKIATVLADKLKQMKH